jgi:ADP-ribose pyrophosphatase
VSDRKAPVSSPEWTVVTEEQILSRPPWFEVWAESVALPDGRLVDPYYRIDQPDYVVVFAVTDKEHVVGIWHYKHGPRMKTLGLPAGYVEPGEKPIDAAQREFLEETGYTAARWRCIGKFCVDGNRGFGWAHIFLADDLTREASPQPDELEVLDLEEMPLHELKDHLANGNVRTLGAAAAVSLGLISLESFKQV